MSVSKLWPFVLIVSGWAYLVWADLKVKSFLWDTHNHAIEVLIRDIRENSYAERK